MTENNPPEHHDKETCWCQSCSAFRRDRKRSAILKLRQMNFHEYQSEAMKIAVYPDRGVNMMYPAAGMSGEAGECLDKIKKIWRNTDSYDPADITEEQKVAIMKEAGDVLWYIAALCDELGVTMEDVARMNIEKLFDRRDRGVLKSEGDDR